ncbi:MAG: hypothetical protein M3198_14460 [Actinomycetota bacterium]|nr:hypothetical protein [Actinomycetota bacterium]
MSGGILSTVTPPHRPCQDLERQSEGLEDDAVHRFVLGEDDRPRRLSTEEASRELGDAFAQRLLINGTFPRTAGEVLSSIEEAVGAGDPLRVHQFFLVGEGSQIPPGSSPVERNLRFLATCGTGPGGPDIMVSAFHPDQGTVEVMAWDERAAGFNYYRTVGRSSAWVFAGNSRHALSPPTRDNGPFESHKSGHFLMKELRLPWVNWDSPQARIDPSVLADEGLLNHPWVRRLAIGGAYTLEEDVALPSIGRWTRARIAALLRGDALETPRRILEQILDTPTVNLISSHTSSEAAVTGAASEVDLPDTFFVDSAALVGILELKSPPTPFVAPSIYAKSLNNFAVTLTDGARFSRPGDTHFAFLVPERAFEDTETLNQAIGQGIVSRRLAACLLMVDFPNPVFSAKRRRLLEHVPDTPISDSAEGFSKQVADAIRGSAAASQPGTAEHEFAARWDVGEDFKDPFDDLLQAYYASFAQRLQTQEGFDNYMRLAESRRARVKDMPIAESPLLFAETNVPRGERRMKEDGTIEEA